MRTKMRYAALTAALMWTATSAAAPQQVALQWKFQPGQQLLYRMTNSNETEMPGGMGVAVVENVVTTRWEVLELDDRGFATVRITNERAQMRMESPMGNFDLDSDAGTQAADPTGGMLTAMAGTSYTLVFDTSGRIEEVRGLEEMRQRMMESAPVQGNPMVGQAFGQMFSEEGIKNMMGQGFAAFPDGPVAPGDSWDTSFDMEIPMFGTITTTSTMTLARVEERQGSRVAVIDTDGTSEMAMDAAPNPAGAAIEMSDAATRGTVEWDLDRGVMTQSTGTTTMSMSIAAGAQQMTMMMVMHTRLELIEG